MLFLRLFVKPQNKFNFCWYLFLYKYVEDYRLLLPRHVNRCCTYIGKFLNPITLHSRFIGIKLFLEHFKKCAIQVKLFLTHLLEVRERHNLLTSRTEKEGEWLYERKSFMLHKITGTSLLSCQSGFQFPPRNFVDHNMKFHRAKCQLRPATFHQVSSKFSEIFVYFSFYLFFTYIMLKFISLNQLPQNVKDTCKRKGCYINNCLWYINNIRQENLVSYPWW